MPTTIFNQILIRIIKEQELVIGPLAWEEARKVQGLQIIDLKNGEVSLQNGDPKNIVDSLVAQYERLFGRASHEVCRDAVRDIVANMTPEEVPSSLR